MTGTLPPTFTDWMAAELDKSLASLPSDQARYRHLILQENVWTGFYDAYATLGRQPFGKPHPRYGDMMATDFVIILGMIAGKRAALEQHRVAA